MNNSINSFVGGDTNNLKNSKNNLIKEYEPLVISIINRKNFVASGVDEYQDLLQEGRVGLLKAIETFDENAGVKFSTYAKRVIENHLINFVKASNNSKGVINNSAFNINNQGEVEFTENEEKSIPIKPISSIEETLIEQENADIFLDNIVKNLSSLETQILKLKLDDFSYTEIATKLGLTNKTVDNALNRIKNKIVKNIKGNSKWNI